MGLTNRVRGWALGGALSLGLGQAAVACAFHGYVPNPTIIDLLLATEQVVVARLDPNNPRRYSAVETLVGPDVADIPITVTAETQALLTRDPSATVLLARDGAYGAWLDLAILDNRFRSVIDRLVRDQSIWYSGGDAERLAVFAGLVNDPNADLRRLALQELDRAPYSALRKAQVPPVQNLRQDLRKGEPDLMPIRVLLAGLSQDQGFASLLSSDLDTAIRNDVAYMGAYATALIELEGDRAVRDILDRHLKDGSLSVQTREKLLQALAVQHKAAPDQTRRTIAIGVAELLRTSPELGEAAARHFGLRSHWSMRSTRPGEQSTGVGSDRVDR
ncbi:MAG: hypothetical protein AAFW87_10090 [Pseudomonadota bacterium]